MSELQPGMLALVVGCRKNPANIGKIVELIKFMRPGDVHDSRRFAGPVAAWKIKSVNLVHLSISGEEIYSDTSYAEARHLLPVRPQADPLDQKQQQELHA